MAGGSLEERVEELESTLLEMQKQLAEQSALKKRGWRWFVGIDADNPHFEEASRLGQEWRYRDRPADSEAK